MCPAGSGGAGQRGEGTPPYTPFTDRISQGAAAAHRRANRFPATVVPVNWGPIRAYYGRSPLRGFICALGFLLPVNGSINSFMLIWSDILSSSNWFYVRLDRFLLAAYRIHKIPFCPKVPVSVLILQVRMPIKYHQAALSFQVSHNLGYAVLRQDAYQHMDVVFLNSNSETFCLSSLPLAIGYFSPRQSRGLSLVANTRRRPSAMPGAFFFTVSVCG